MLLLYGLTPQQNDIPVMLKMRLLGNLTPADLLLIQILQQTKRQCILEVVGNFFSPIAKEIVLQSQMLRSHCLAARGIRAILSVYDNRKHLLQDQSNAHIQYACFCSTKNSRVSRKRYHLTLFKPPRKLCFDPFFISTLCLGNNILQIIVSPEKKI